MTGLLSEPKKIELLNHEDEYVRAWTIQLLCEDRMPSDKALKTFKKMAKEDQSAVVRLYLASASQRIQFNDRWPILEELVKHKQDVKDHNLPNMLWYALEPMVPDHSEKALTLAVTGQIPLLQELVPRRMAAKKPPKNQAQILHGKSTFKKLHLALM